jgi:hypothetical protein
MQKLSTALLFLIAALSAGTIMSATAHAVPIGPVGQLSVAADHLNLIENTRYVYRGRSYCWYNHGWNGPGWYWCGYDTRRGYGWGGPRGWNSWYWSGWGPVPPVVVVPRGRYYWNGRYYNDRYWHGGRWRYR